MLGPFGVTVAGFLFAVAQAATIYVAYRATKRAKTAEAWQSTALANASAAAAAKSEKDVYKEKVERVERERLELVAANERLKAATDLTQLSAANQEEHGAIVEALQSLVRRQDEHHAQLLAATAENTRALLGFQSQIAGVFEGITANLRAMERSMTGLHDSASPEKR